MRVRIRLPDAQQLERLTERIPDPPVLIDGSEAPGFRTSPDDERGKFRSEARRDRDRILYSSAFQRLSGVTQVIESEPGFTFHTRLTHSLKVAQIARRLSEKLLQEREGKKIQGRAAQLLDALDPDAAEAAALGHDLGHPPFGHVAETELNDRSSAGFEGNAQSFRILTRLSVRDQDPGLSLTRQTLDGVLKYPWLREQEGERPARSKKWGAYDSDAHALQWTRLDSHATARSLIAQIMDWADDLTYAVHDLDDFYRAGLIPLHRLAAQNERELERFEEGLIDAKRKDPKRLVDALEEVWGWYGVREAYEGLVGQRADLKSASSDAITAYLDAFTIEEGSEEGYAVIKIDEGARLQVKALKDLTWVYVVRRPSLAVMQAGRRRVIANLYDWYYDATKPRGDERLLPPAYRDRLQPGATAKTRSRLVTDLISGLTERAAIELYRRMSGVDPGTLLDAAARPV